MRTDKLAIDQIIDEWGPRSLERMALIRGRLDLSSDGSNCHREINDALDLLASTYLQPGY